MFKKRIIIDLVTGSPYLIRRPLFSCRRFSIKLHHIVRSDLGRHLHDHPWDFVTVILWGGYYEVTPLKKLSNGTITGNQWYKPGSIIRHKAKDRHRVELKNEKACWSLVICGPRKREWGFHTDTGWMHWKEYIFSLFRGLS